MNADITHDREITTAHEHFDISLGCRRKAVAAGAIEITQRKLGQKLIERSAES